MDEVKALAYGEGLPANPTMPIRKPGRPWGSRNYSGVSLIARTMKERGLSWITEFIDAYQIYKQQLKAYADDASKPEPNPQLLQFWMEVLPYITVKMIERETRGIRPKRKFKKKISHAALEALAKAEGRKI